MRRVIWGIVALVSILVLGAIGIVSAFEQVTETRPVRPLPIAYTDRFKVAERILHSQNVAAQTIQGLQQRPALRPGDVAVIPALRGAVSPRTAERLIAEIEAGAHVIVESEWIDNPDPLFDALGITRAPIDRSDEDDDEYSDSEDDTESESEDEGTETWDETEFDDLPFGGWMDWTERMQNHPLSSPMLLTATWEGDESFKFSIYGGESLGSSQEADFWLGSEGDVRVFSFSLGKGHVTAINDISFMTNFSIGRNDNAEVFWRFVNHVGTPSEVMFLVPREPGLFLWLKNNAWRALIALCVLVLIWLLAVAPRFGPVRRDPEPVRRRLLDHLRAAGRLLWHGGARTHLVDAAQRAAQRQVERQFPNFAARDPAEKARILVRQYGFSSSQVALLLQPELAADAHTFIALIKLARVIHSKAARVGHETLYTE